MTIPAIRPAAIICTECGGSATNPAADAHAGHQDGCTALAAFRDAMAKARRIESDATWAAAVTASQQGTSAIAEAAFVPGGPSVEEIQARYEDLQARTRTAGTGRAA